LNYELEEVRWHNPLEEREKGKGRRRRKGKIRGRKHSSVSIRRGMISL
jgi:hypothetical protein